MIFSLQLIYAGLTLFNWIDVVKSQSGLGLSGVLLVTLTVAGGLGCCALIDIPFNAITTQVIPVWVVCMGINPIFIMTQTYTEICNSNIPMEVRNTFWNFNYKYHQFYVTNMDLEVFIEALKIPLATALLKKVTLLSRLSYHLKFSCNLAEACGKAHFSC